MKETDFLPLGSIVFLKGGDKKLMIYGRRQVEVESKEEFDYIACLWPEGNLDEEYTYLFNGVDIAEVVHQGYTDDEDLVFLEVLNRR